ncbi:MAG: hypothetical protein K0U21_06245 [Proteobacteria bacterium]|nr:hypothetical protein [Pseudomonadota bacterium]
MAKKFKFSKDGAYASALDVDEITSEFSFALCENEEKLLSIFNEEGLDSAKSYLYQITKNKLMGVNQQLSSPATIKEKIRSRDSEDVKEAKRMAMQATSESYEILEQVESEILEPLAELLEIEDEHKKTKIMAAIKTNCPVFFSTLPNADNNLAAARLPIDIRIVKIQRELVAFCLSDLVGMDKMEAHRIGMLAKEIFQSRYIRPKEAKSA